MKKWFLFSGLIFFLASCNNRSHLTVGVLSKGVSEELANYRKRQIAAVCYKMSLQIPNEKSASIPSVLEIDLKLVDLKQDLYLDFNADSRLLKSLNVNGVITNINHKEEHIIISKNNLKLGDNNIKISFDAGELSLNRNDDFLYTLFVPDRASTLFPCFDQPNIKAVYQLTITAPKDWKVLCGAFEEKQQVKGDFITHYFRKTDLMSTYLFSFVAGKFEEITKNPGAFPMRFVYSENNQEKIDESMEAIFSIHQQSLDFLEKYTYQKFPFQKMDFASIPPFQYGGMEHVGAIQYRESSLFLDKNATQNQQLNRAKLIAHETSHMWFGDLVTMRWFDDVWMKEVFANFMADKIMNPVFSDINHSLQFMMTHYPSAYSEDRTKGTNAIRQPLKNLKDAGSLYGRIIYNKAPIMMRQLEAVLGEKSFQKGIQSYIKTFANSNADWNNLVTILDKETTMDLKKWSDVWVNKSGRPILTDSISYTNHEKISSFKIYQTAEDGTDKIWPQIFQIGLVYKDSVHLIHTAIDTKSTTLNEAIGLEKPLQIIYNYNGFGYGVFPLQINQTHLIKTIKNDVARAYSYINLYEQFLTSNISAKQTIETFLEAIHLENNELITNFLSGRISTIYWTFLTSEQQISIQQKLENDIYSKLLESCPANIKKTLFNLYTSTAISNKGISNLYGIWSKQIKIQQLFLNEDDYTSLASKLAIYNHPKASEILSKQREQITNPDKLHRFDWLLPTLSNEITTRDSFMLSLKDKENREKESWVSSALNNIHHPLRQLAGIKHLRLCLELLEEIQLTGDIFFPKSWLQSSLGNYSSKEAFIIVEEFFKNHVNYHPILKKKILQTVDNLYRAQHIKY